MVKQLLYSHYTGLHFTGANLHRQLPVRIVGKNILQVRNGTAWSGFFSFAVIAPLKEVFLLLINSSRFSNSLNWCLDILSIHHPTVLYTVSRILLFFKDLCTQSHLFSLSTSFSSSSSSSAITANS